MDVYINEVNSTLRATDSQALLNPAVLSQVIALVRQVLREEQAREQRAAAERRLRRGVSGDGAGPGETEP